MPETWHWTISCGNNKVVDTHGILLRCQPFFIHKLTRDRHSLYGKGGIVKNAILCARRKHDRPSPRDEGVFAIVPSGGPKHFVQISSKFTEVRCKAAYHLLVTTFFTPVMHHVAQFTIRTMLIIHHAMHHQMHHAIESDPDQAVQVPISFNRNRVGQTYSTVSFPFCSVLANRGLPDPDCCRVHARSLLILTSFNTHAGQHDAVSTESPPMDGTSGDLSVNFVIFKADLAPHPCQFLSTPHHNLDYTNRSPGCVRSYYQLRSTNIIRPVFDLTTTGLYCIARQRTVHLAGV